MTQAPVNRIIPFSTVDGPGCRTAVFLQACNLSCGYCHNPETQNLCLHCGKCVDACPAGALSKQDGRVIWDAAKCEKCDTCLQVCPHRASPRVQWMTPEAVLRQVAAPFVRGITVSGGECMLWPPFLQELFTLAKRSGLTCLIDSNGTFSFAEYPELMQVCDGVMLDVKAWSPQVFRTLTGGENDTVRQNVSFLAETGKLAEIRVVCGQTDADDVLAGTAALLGERVGRTRLVLIAFRPAGVRGPFADMEPPSAQEMERLRAFARTVGFSRIVVK